jgi:hypothetical protein
MLTQNFRVKILKTAKPDLQCIYVKGGYTYLAGMNNLGVGRGGGVFEMHVNEWPQTTRVSMPLLLCIHKESKELEAYRLVSVSFHL